MSETEQLQIDRVWTTDGFIGVPTGVRSEDRQKTIADSILTRDSRVEDCRDIELFPGRQAAVQTTRQRSKRYSQSSLMETATILMLTAAASIALFATIGYLCRW